MVQAGYTVTKLYGTVQDKISEVWYSLGNRFLGHNKLFCLLYIIRKCTCSLQNWCLCNIKYCDIQATFLILVTSYYFSIELTCWRPTNISNVRHIYLGIIQLFILN